MSNALNAPGMEFYITRVSIFNKEGLDAITTVIHELEQAGYITRARVRNEKGQLREMEYTVYSSPKLNRNTAKSLSWKNQRNKI